MNQQCDFCDKEINWFFDVSLIPSEESDLSDIFVVLCHDCLQDFLKSVEVEQRVNDEEKK